MAGFNDVYSKKTKPSSDSHRRKTLYRPLTFFLIVFCIVLAMSVFFKISRIEVSGNSLYTTEEVIAASGIYEGDNLFFLNRIAAGTRVAVKLPYVESVTINRGLPNIVRIVVEESKASACVDIDGVYWTVSSGGKCLGPVDADKTSEFAAVTGIALETPAEGSDFEAKAGEQEKLDYLLDILDQIHARQLVDKVTGIDMTELNCPVIEYEGRFNVKLGANDNTEYKFGKLLAAVEQLGADDAGTLDVSEGNKVEFKPN